MQPTKSYTRLNFLIVYAIINEIIINVRGKNELADVSNQ